jgi:hypothetical protein
MMSLHDGVQSPRNLCKALIDMPCEHQSPQKKGSSCIRLVDGNLRTNYGWLKVEEGLGGEGHTWRETEEEAKAGLRELPTLLSLAPASSVHVLVAKPSVTPVCATPLLPTAESFPPLLPV